LRKIKCDAVSPVIAVILLVAITIVLAGLVTLWVFSLVDEDEGSGTYHFEARIDTSEQELMLTVVSGPVLDPSAMRVLVGETEMIIPAGTGVLNAADSITLTPPSGFTFEVQVVYHVKVVVDNRMVWEQDVNGGP